MVFEKGTKLSKGAFLIELFDFQMYKIYVNHHFGNSSLRYLLLTSYAVYLLNSNSTSPNKNGEEEGSAKVSSNGSAGSKYSREIVVPYAVIDYVSVSDSGRDWGSLRGQLWVS